MPKRVHLPDGRIVNFPDTMTPEAIQVAMVKLTQGHAPAPDRHAAPDGSAAARFLSNAGEMVNPVNIAKGIYGAVRHPVTTAVAIGRSQADQFQKAKTAFNEGRYVEAGGHGMASAIPVLGPVAAEAGEQIGAGDIAGGLGKAVGVLAPTMVPTAIRGARAAVRTIPNKIANAADAAAASRVADVMSPKVGAHKARLGNMAERVAPALAKDLAADGAPLTRSGFHAQVQTKLAQAEQALDAASDARLAARTFPTNQLIGDLMAKRRQLMLESVQGSRPIPTVQGAGGIPTPSGMTRNVSTGQMQRTLTKEGRPLGKDVVPGPNAARVAVIDQAIAELKQLGPVTRYDPVRTMRHAYDGQAKVVYSPAVTADFLKARGSALGAADVTSVLRESLAKWDGPTATANAQYSLYRTADDVLKATAEVERVRPKVGRQIIARMTGTILGGQQAGAPGAVAGYVAGPLVDSALASGVTTQLKTAALLAKLSSAIQGGNVSAVASLTAQLKSLARRVSTTGAAQAGRLTSPSGLQAQPEPAR